MTKDEDFPRVLRDLIRSGEVREQSQLQQLLEERGYALPQATLSRRLKKLGIVKIAGVYQSLEVPRASVPHILSIQESAFGFFVLHTMPGSASALAYAIDQQYVEVKGDSAAILGTIAGDDTVLVLIKSPQDMGTARALLNALSLAP